VELKVPLSLTHQGFADDPSSFYPLVIQLFAMETIAYVLTFLTLKTDDFL